MSKTLKIIFLISLFFILICGFSFATETTYTDESQTTSLENTESIDSSNYSSGITSVSPMSNYSDANLSLNNILNIFLIAIGILIVLLAIAILIRLKQ